MIAETAPVVTADTPGVAETAPVVTPVVTEGAPVVSDVAPVLTESPHPPSLRSEGIYPAVEVPSFSARFSKFGIRK